MSVTEAIAEGAIESFPEFASLRRAIGGAARISVVIPTFNDAASLPHVMTRLPTFVDEVVLVDGHSIDDTIAVAHAIRPDVRVVLQDARGKGNALACGFAAAGGEIIVTLDADGSADPAEIPKFVCALLDGNDFARGSRFAGGGRSRGTTPLRRAGSRGVSRLASLLFGTHFSDLCHGSNAFWCECLPHMQLTGGGPEVHARINVRLARAGLRVAEVASVEHAPHRRESALKTVRDGLRILRTILTERMRRDVPGNQGDAWCPPFGELAASHEHRAAAELRGAWLVRAPKGH